MTTKSNGTPYTPDKLYAQASKLAADWNIPEKWREDAVQEFVVGAITAADEAKTSVRSCQHRSGRNAMLNFLRREERAEERAPSGCHSDAKRISLEMPTSGMDGEPTTLAETVRDRDMPAPGAGLVAASLEAAAKQAMSRLTPEEAEAARRVYIEGETQTAAADAMGLTRDQIRSRLASALPILRVWLADFRALAGE